MTGAELIAAIRKRHKKETQESGSDHQISQYLGITLAQLTRIENTSVISPSKIAELLSRSSQVATEITEENTIKPIVEFFPITLAWSARYASYEVLNVYVENGDEHPYHAGLRDQLKQAHGIYIFHDSRGRALYVGKARLQNLWKEMNLTFNRDRQVQTIRKVDHPARMQAFKTYDEIRRKIRERSVPLYNLATYFSAFKVADRAINDLEALLIRSFPNDLLNKKMENFAD